MAITELPAGLDFPTFIGLVEDRTGRDLSGAEPCSLLRDDLGLDSIDMIELLSVLDSFGVDMHEELLCELRTMGDVHHYLNSLGGTPPRSADGILEGARLALRPVRACDADYLWSLCSAGEHLIRYRMRGMTLGPDQFRRMVWDRVVAQFVVHGAHGPVGWVTSFDPDFRNRYVFVAAVADPAIEETGLVAEATAMLISYLFSQFDLRKVYAETLACNFERFASGADRIFDVEGRLKDHEYLDGHYEDLLTLATTRESWRTTHRRLFASPPPF